MPKYLKLYNPQDSAVVFIDHQPQMTFGVANIGRALLMNNVVLLSKVAKEFRVPSVLAALSEWQRDWARREHDDALMALLEQHAGAYASGVEYACTMVHKAPQSARVPQVVRKTH